MKMNQITTPDGNVHSALGDNDELEVFAKAGEYLAQTKEDEPRIVARLKVKEGVISGLEIIDSGSEMENAKRVFVVLRALCQDADRSNAMIKVPIEEVESYEWVFFRTGFLPETDFSVRRPGGALPYSI